MNTKPLINVPSLVLLLAMSAMPTLLLAADAESSSQSNSTNAMDSNSMDSTNSSNTQGDMPDTSMQTNSGSADSSTGQNATNAGAGSNNAASASSSSTNSATITSTQTTNDWKTPLAAEFAKLDKSGNGLLLRNEASRGKAFSKKTFDTADADKDGAIDEQEYISFKGGESSPATANTNKQNDSANSGMSDNN